MDEKQGLKMEPVTVAESISQETWQDQGPWCVIVWNDPVNLMSYVTYVLQRHFGYSQARAHELMLEIHELGRAAVSSGNREKIELDVQAMHSFGLWATMERVE